MNKTIKIGGILFRMAIAYTNYISSSCEIALLRFWLRFRYGVKETGK